MFGLLWPWKLLLVAFLLLVAMPFAPSSVLAPTRFDLKWPTDKLWASCHGDFDTQLGADHL